MRIIELRIILNKNTRHVQERTYTVVRFTNDQGPRQLDAILAEILRHCEALS
jgi:very-short-patch-repair endonuclease